MWKIKFENSVVKLFEKLDKTKENYYEYLNLNDLIILEPDGMYEGKILTK